MLLTFIKLPFVSKIFVLSIFECSLKTGFTVFLLFLIVAILKFMMSITAFELSWLDILLQQCSHLYFWTGASYFFCKFERFLFLFLHSKVFWLTTVKPA